MFRLRTGGSPRPWSAVAAVVRLEDRTTPTLFSVTTLTADPASLPAGDTVTLTAVVADPFPSFLSYNPSGEVTFVFDGATLGTLALAPVFGSNTSSSATMKVATGTFGAGTFVVAAEYSGEPFFWIDGYDPSDDATTVTLTAASPPPPVSPPVSPPPVSPPPVSPPPARPTTTTTAVAANPATASVGKDVVFTATVTAAPAADAYSPTGLVSFRLGDTVLGNVSLAAGPNATATATMTVATATFGAGAFTVSAVYAGEAKTDGYAGSDGSGPVSFVHPTPPVLSPPPIAPQPLPPQEPLPPLPAAGSGVRLTAVAADAGVPGTVSVFNADGTKRFEVAPYSAAFTGGVRVAVADANGDGVPDLLAVPGPGRPVQLKVFSGTDGAPLWERAVFEASFTGGGFVSAGDLTGDGKADAVVSPDEFGGPRVRVFSGADQGVVADYFGIDDPNFRGGARTAVGDFDADGRDDLAVVAGVGGGPRVALFDGQTVPGGRPGRLTNDFFVFEQTLRNGVYVAAGDVDGAAGDDLVVGGGPGGGPRVMALRGPALAAGNTGDVAANFFAGDTSFRGGVRVAVGDPDGDGTGDILAGIGPGGPAAAAAYRANGTVSQTLPGTRGGVFVGGAEAPVRAARATGGTRPLSGVDVAGRFIPGADTRVVFTDGRGFRAEVPATEVTADRVRVGLPVYRDMATGRPAGGELTAAVVQRPAGGGDVYSGAFAQRIDGLPESNLPAGTYTRMYLEAARDRIAAAAEDARTLAYLAGDGFEDEVLDQPADEIVGELDRQIAEIEHAQTGVAVPLPGTYGPVTRGNLSLPDLGTMDRMLAPGADDMRDYDRARQSVENLLEQAASDIRDSTGRFGDAAEYLGYAGVGPVAPIASAAALATGHMAFVGGLLAGMLEVATKQILNGSVTPGQAAQSLAPQYIDRVADGLKGFVQQWPVELSGAEQNWVNGVNGVSQYFYGRQPQQQQTTTRQPASNSFVGWASSGQQLQSPTSQANRLYKTWTQTRDLGEGIVLTYKLSLSPGQASVTISGKPNTYDYVGSGSGPATVDGTTASGSFPGTLQEYNPFTSKNESKRDTISFTASLNDDGTLNASILGVTLSRMR